MGNVEIINNAISKSVSKVKDKICYLNISVSTNISGRKIVYTMFKDKSFCYNPNTRLSWHDYLVDLAHSKFVLSPQGNGLDCHRTWEALYMGCIPIVKNSLLNDLYEDLPVVIVDDWAEVTEEFLNAKWLEIQSKKFNIQKAYF